MPVATEELALIVPGVNFRVAARDLLTPDLNALQQTAQWVWQHRQEDHPAVEPWRTTPVAVLVYGLFLTAEMRNRPDRRKGNDRAWDWFESKRKAAVLKRPQFRRQVPMPAWLGEPATVSAHRQWLMTHDAHYYDVWPDEPEPFGEVELWPTI